MICAILVHTHTDIQRDSFWPATISALPDELKTTGLGYRTQQTVQTLFPSLRSRCRKYVGYMLRSTPFLSRVTRHLITRPRGAGQNMNNSTFSVGSGIFTAPLALDTCTLHSATVSRHSVESALFYIVVSITLIHKYLLEHCSTVTYAAEGQGSPVFLLMLLLSYALGAITGQPGSGIIVCRL